jgi:hypothetical protein
VDVLVEVGDADHVLVAQLGRQALAERDARNIERLARELRTTGVIRVPYLDEDVHDLGGLAEIDRYLFASSEEREALAAGRA